MLSLSRKADYGLVALAGLAARSDTASARELSDSLHLPLPALRNLLKAAMKRELSQPMRPKDNQASFVAAAIGERFKQRSASCVTGLRPRSEPSTD